MIASRLFRWLLPRNAIRVTIQGLEVATPGFVLNARDPTEARTMAHHLRRGDYRKALDLHARAA